MQLKYLILAVLVVITFAGVSSASFLDDIMGAAINEYETTYYETPGSVINYYAPQPGSGGESPVFETVGIDFIATPSGTIRKGTTITLNAFQTSGTTLGSNTRWQFCYGNNVFANGQSISFRLTTPGTFGAKLTVLDNDNKLTGSTRKNGLWVVK